MSFSPKLFLVFAASALTAAVVPARAAPPPGSIVGSLVYRCLHDPSESDGMDKMIVSKIKFEALEENQLSSADIANGYTFKAAYRFSYISRQNARDDWHDQLGVFRVEIRNGVLDFSEGSGQLFEEFCRYRWRLAR